METWSQLRRIGWAAKATAGLGAVGAGLEAVGAATRGALPDDLTRALLCVAVGVTLSAIAAAVVGLLAGVVQLAFKSMAPHRAVALQVGVAGGVLTLALMEPMLFELVARGQEAQAVVLGIMGLSSIAVIYFNARFWISRWLVGRLPGGWTLGSLGGGLLVASAAAVLSTGSGSGFALEGDRSALLVTLDGARMMQPSDREAMPRLYARAASGTSFETSVTPTPHPVVNHGVVLTALHPVRHGALTEEAPLHPGLERLPSLLANEGWRTAAFASSAWLGEPSGLLEGFQTRDLPDAPVVGLTGFTVGRWLVTALADLGASGGLVRADHATVDAALAWMAAHQGETSFVWVHLAGGLPPWGDVHPPRAGHDAAAWSEAGAAWRAALTEMDGELDRLLAGATEQLDDPVMLVVGTSGMALGEHGLGPGIPALFDESLRVPWVLMGPDVPVAIHDRPMARLEDVGPTMLAAVGLEGFADSRGKDLREPLSLDVPYPLFHGAQVGLRTLGTKVMVDLSGEEASVFDLTSDAAEQRNLSADQQPLIDEATAALAPDQRALRSYVSPVIPRSWQATLDAVHEVYGWGRVQEGRP